METRDIEGGDAWADIPDQRSPEGRAVADGLRRAEETVLAVQDRLKTAIEEPRDDTDDFEAFKDGSPKA